MLKKHPSLLRGSGERLSAKQQEILNLIQLDPNISAERIASEIWISTRKTEDHLWKILIGGFLRKVGPRRGGHWEVLVTPTPPPNSVFPLILKGFSLIKPSK